MAKRKKSKKQMGTPVLTPWDNLRRLIYDYTDAVVADSWKGGGDPVDYPVIEATLALAKAQLEQQLQRMEKNND